MPIIVFLLFIYYGLPGLNILLDAYTSAVLVLSFVSGAVTSEIFRSGIESIHVSQIEAARALGLSSAQTMQYVILPQTFRWVVPPLANSWIGTLKDTAVCSVVALVELLKGIPSCYGRESKSNTFDCWYSNLHCHHSSPYKIYRIFRV